MAKTTPAPIEALPLDRAASAARSKGGRRRRRRGSGIRPTWQPYAFVAPFILLFLGLYLVPKKENIKKGKKK
jgi:hypothetical protein